ncbi:MAG: Ig-like domain-containing protein, partial [Gemmatimonadetes bacterium]|nr:Ig-like domain-containing protein [Gemmatimonadota bacterium]
DLTVEVGSTESVDLAAYFSDPDGDVLTYTASSSNTSIATVSVSGDIVQVTAVAAGNATVTVTATDPDELSAEQTFTVTVPNQGPEAGEPIEDIDMFIGEAAQVDVSRNFSDPDGDALSYTASTRGGGVVMVTVSGSVVTASAVSPGTGYVTVKAADPGGLSATQAFAVTVTPNERPALEILYDEVDGDNWDDNTNWLTDAPLDEWYGVITDADGWVVALDLSNNSLTGELPPELGSLSNLGVLYLHDNSVTGEIPSELGDLSNLVRLWLQGNSLTGEIPPELGDLSRLVYLFLFDNSLTGEIPSELGDLSSLGSLDLHGNSLTGPIPQELGSLSNLQVLELEANSLTGEIPSELGSLSRLAYLSVGDNRLTGEIPPELGDLSSLEILYLDHNLLTGEPPSELGDLSDLEILYLQGNSLTGETPLEFLDLSLQQRFFWDDNDGLCVPNTSEFDDWLDGIALWRGPRCE